MKKMKKPLILLLLALLLLGGVGLVKHKQRQLSRETPPRPAPVLVEVRQLQVAPVSLSLHATAEVQAVQDSVVASRLSAYLTALPFFEGDRFRRGAVLARLDTSQAQAELQQAEASLAQSRLQAGTLAAELASAASTLRAEQERYGRLQALYRIQGVSLEQVQAAEAQLAGARARFAAARAAQDGHRSLLRANQAAVAAARENLRYGVILAPFDGVVSQRLAQPGDMVTPGKPLLKITNPATGVRLLISVPAGLQPVALRLDGRTLPLRPWPEATVQGLRRYETRLLEAAPLPGTRQDVQVIVFQSAQAISLPRHCLLNEDGRSATVLRLTAQNRVEPWRVALAAAGDEGAATLDERLPGQRIACGSPDLLTRLAAGAPFQTQPTPRQE
ncbi:biotin/lipoyl-binding protein [Thermithiobacillus tepidarius DSM 3134]|uniref:efflux RND transporter periplasmic adaptor subunit n=1 Tax=Thermithiobacillus tepidarius TaxID=929 RepID=UPI00040463E2|nr:HlyD family efflux transporter periplasmic adaptor subunit [Thermithiobacillus tepidarius]